MTAPARPRPSVRHRRLAHTLRDLRTDQGLSRGKVSEQTGIHTATLYRIEAARVRPQLRTLDTLLALYHATDEQRRTLTRLITETGQVEWLQAYADVLSEPSRAAIEFEDEAHTVCCYSALRVPDLLQTPAYTRAVSLDGHSAGDRQATERHIELQIRRRAVLTHPTRPVQLRAVCDEAVLHRPVGGPHVMREQLQYLTEMAELPNLTVQLIPFEAGAYPRTPGDFTLMHLPDGTSAVHIENAAADDRMLTTTEDTRRCAELLARIQQAALPPAESLELIATYIRRNVPATGNAF